MGGFSNLEYELFAAISLHYAFPSLTQNIVKKESPDWQDEENDVGIEVTRAQNNHIGYTKSVVCSYLGKPKESIPLKIRESFLGSLYYNNTERLHAISDCKGLFDGNRHIKLAVERAQHKLGCLNQPHFKYFSRNFLYMFMTMPVIEGDCDEFLSLYLELIPKFKYSYSDILLMDYDSLSWINVAERNTIKHSFLNDEIKSFGVQTYLLSAASDWMDTAFETTLKTVVNNKSESNTNI